MPRRGGRPYFAGQGADTASGLIRRLCESVNVKPKRLAGSTAVTRIDGTRRTREDTTARETEYRGTLTKRRDTGDSPVPSSVS